MRAAAWFALVIAVAACSQPERRRKRPDTVFVGRLGDREHPTEILVDGGLGEARATAPGPGTWWYLVRVKPRIDAITRITVTAHHVTSWSQSSPGRVRVDVVDGTTEIAGIATKPGESEVVLEERPEPIEPLLVRVTTLGKARFYLSAFRESRAIPQPPPPPRCDHHNIDPSNPNCAGVSPHCNLDDPDFSNPDCCEAECEFGAHRCRAKVLSGGPDAANIAIGTSRHMMRFATGILYQRGKAVSRILVRMVKDDWSFIQILSPHNVDQATLVENGEVVLFQPEACQRR